MASRVNKKFVAILAVALVVVGGAAMYAGYVALRKSGADYIRKGDAAMTEGDYKRASVYYGIAYNHDRTRADWLDKWVAALEAWTPATRTEYSTQFSQLYMPVIKQVAHTKRTDLAAHDRYLGMVLDQIQRVPYSREAADHLINETEASLTFFEYAPEDDTSWWRLRRYRGLGISTIISQGGTLQPGVREEAIADLQAALQVDPTDSMAALGLAQIHDRAADDARLAKKYEEMARERTKTREIIEAFVKDNPESPEGMVALLGVEINELQEKSQVEAARKGERPRTPDVSGYKPRLDEIVAKIRETGDYDDRLLGRVRGLEGAIDPEASLRRTEALVNEALEKSPNDARLLFALSEINNTQNDQKEVLNVLQRIQALKPIPMSLDGLFQFHYQEQALVTEARTHLAIREALEDTPANKDARARELTAAQDARKRFAQLVPESDARLTMLDGMLAIAGADLRTALSKFQQYNQQRSNLDIEGLWHEAQVAAQLDRLGVARERLDQILELQPQNLAATLLLGQVEINLANYQNAESLFQEVLEVDPTNQVAQSGITQARIAQNKEQSEDPIRAALIESTRIREGTARDAGDPKRAIDYLETKFEELKFHPRIARELASLYLVFDDIASARSAIDRAIKANPDDETLAQLREALNADDSTDVGVTLIKGSDASERDKLLAINALYRRANRTADADLALDRLTEIAPEDPSVLDLRLVRALRDKNESEAVKITDIAERTDADQANGATFRARLEASRGKPEDAMALLERAIKSGAQDSAVYRLLAQFKIANKDLRGAIGVYQQALNIRPDDIESILGYLKTLVTANQIQQALQRARDMEQYGRRSPEFMDMWLRLEAVAGGQAGVAFAIERRERILELSPQDRANRIELARLYVLGRKFGEARKLIDELRREKDELALVDLDARWHADQVTVPTPQGPRDGVTMAREVYSRYLVGLPTDEMGPAYVSMAQFMLNRGRPQVAIEALKEARQTQDPKTRTADKMLAEVYSAVQEWELALETYRSLAADGLDDENKSIQKRVVESLLRLYRYDEAGQELKKIENLAPMDISKLPPGQKPDTTVRLQQAEVALGKGDRTKALQFLDRAVNESPNEPLVYIQRAKVKASDPALSEDVLTDLEQALRLNPDDWRTLRVRAGYYYQLERDEDAIKDLKSAIRINPGMDDVIFSLVSELVDKGRAGEASTVADEAIKARLGDTQLTTQVAVMFAEKNEWARAAMFYRQAWDKSGSTPIAMRLIDAQLRCTPPQIRDAQDVFNAVALQTPNASADPAIMATRAIIEYTQGNRQEGEARMAEAFDKAIDDVGEVSTWAANVGRMYEGQPKDSILAFLTRMASTKAPGTPGRDWLELFTAQEMLGNDQTRDEALSRLQTLRETTKVSQIPRLAYRLAGRAYYGQENFTEAANVWREGLAKFPGDWEMLNNLGYVTSEKMGDPEGGLAMVEQALEVSPDNPQALDTKAAILVTLGRNGEARVALDRALRIVRDLDTRVSLWMRQARVYLALGNVPQAEALLEQAKANVNVSRRRMERFESDIKELESEIDSARP
ncbi:MAG: tetratricopeptide repeat protein [Phycisphaerales bacterium]